MGREDVVRLIKGSLSEFRADYDVVSLSIFGSTARGNARPDSDIDILVDFSSPPGFRQFMQLKFALEDLLGEPVDLVDRAALRPAWKKAIEEDALLVA